MEAGRDVGWGVVVLLKHWREGVIMSEGSLPDRASRVAIQRV